MFLEKAKEREKTYEWAEAAKCYEKTLLSGQEDASRVGDTLERIGFCYSWASQQAESVEEFKKLRQLAVDAYQRSTKAIEKEVTPENQEKIAQRKTVTGFIGSWLASTSSEKKSMLDESLRIGKEGLERIYKMSTDQLGFAKMYNNLLLCFFERLCVASDWREYKTIVQEGVNCGSDAIRALSEHRDKDELLQAYSMASLLNWNAANVSEQEERERKELSRTSLDYSEKARELSKEVNSPFPVAMANWAEALSTLVFTEKVEEALTHGQEMLKQGTILKDNYLKGIAYYILAFVTDWMMMREGDPDKKKEGHRNIIQLSENAVRCLELVSQDFFIAETCLFYAESYTALGSDVELSSGERRKILTKAIDVGRKGLEHAENSGSADALGATLHALSKALHFYSNLEADNEEKKKYLEEALLHRNEFDKVVEKAFPSNDWLIGVHKNYVGLIKLDMAKIETDNEKKKVLLESSAGDTEDSIAHCKRWVQSRPVPTNISALASFEDAFGKTLDKLFELTKDRKFLEKAIETYEDAAKQYKKITLSTRAAESYWKTAINQDRLGQHIKAAEHFGNAFTQYKEAAQRIPHFADFCLDYAMYMNAWSMIEKAKSAHEHEDFADASSNYEKVATILEPSKRWGYLSSNFQAWSLLEKAEDLSRKENCTESTEAFNGSAQLFKETKDVFEEKINQIENPDEREKTIELCKASLQRIDYCVARIDVEEARVADKNGNHAESAAKYESAATLFERILQKEADEKDIKQIALMCLAWQKMKMADSKISAELYHEASELFFRVKENSTKDKAALLASGNGAFCLALEHGTLFESTRERIDFSRAKQHLENAANCYLKAGFDGASSWTSATEMLLDASNYMTEAEMEPDQEEKMKKYVLAEKCLERSADLFQKAGYTGRKDEVLRTLTKAREKREFALSLEDFLSAPAEASSTRTMSPPRMTIEEPVGLVKFERAFVQANLIMHQNELVVGETLSLEIQIANLGKELAFLTGIEEVIPEQFSLVEKPEKCVIDDHGFNLKGRKLAPLETAEIKLALKPKKKGKFTFAPRIKYMQETGEHKSCELEQAHVNVKELGIRGWLKGQA